MENYKPKVSIILLNYNGYEDSISCLQSLQKISYINYDVIIVDNASLDISMDKILAYMQENDIEYVFYDTPENAMSKSLNAKVSLIQSCFNGGYGYGNNIGIKYALMHGADYVLILNNDTVVDHEFLEPMVQVCEDDLSIGIASGKIYFHDKPDTIWFNGGGYNQYTGKVEHFNFKEKDIGQVPKAPITFITGCMWLIPSKVFKTIGFINEEYFMYTEDLEYCQRLIQGGYTLKVIENGAVYHKVGSCTGGQYSSFSVFWRTRNMNKLIVSNKCFFRRFSAFLVFNLKTIMQLVKAKKLTMLKYYFKAIFSVWKDDNAT